MVDKKCEACWKLFTTRYKKQRFCCQSCAQMSKRRDVAICLYCWMEFHPKRAGTKYCSRECYELKRAKKEKQCKVCWKKFIWCRDTQQYCSKECWMNDISLEIITKICPTCWKTFNTKEKNQKYCSERCRNHQKRICEMCWVEFITNSYNQKACSDCTDSFKKKWRNAFRTYICKYCWEEFEWAYRTTTCKKCIKKNSSKHAKKMIQDYMELSEEDKQLRKEKISKSVKNTINNIDKEKREERQHKKSISLRSYYANMTEEEYEAYHNNLVERAKERLKKTWYMWPVQQPEVWGAVKNVSEEEKIWKEQFTKMGYDVEIQFPLWQYRYDLKIWNTLIEVNPFPFHNSTRVPPKSNAKPKHPMYHYNKTKCAVDNWYNIINIWSWVWLDEVVSLLDKATLLKEVPVLHRYNPKTKEHLIDDWFSAEDMIANGYVEIRDWWEFYSVNTNQDG